MVRFHYRLVKNWNKSEAFSRKDKVHLKTKKDFYWSEWKTSGLLNYLDP